MIGCPDHPASHRLALLALCGDLVVAIDAMAIHEIRSAEAGDATAAGISALEVEGAAVPGWDLGELLGIGACRDAWAIVVLPRVGRRIGLRIGRCVMVHPLPVCRTIPRGIFSAADPLSGAGRAGAISAGFSVAGIPELADHVSGVVVDLAHLLTERELASFAPPPEPEREARRDVR